MLLCLHWHTYTLPLSCKFLTASLITFFYIKNYTTLFKKSVLYILLFCVYNISFAQVADTLEKVSLSTTHKNIVAQVLPVQALNAKQLLQNNKNSVAEVIKQLAGVQVKDYGGAGGLKTVSVRSLGANHTGIIYDGFAISDAQGGQIDLGKFALDNIAQITLYNNANTQLLQPAKNYSYASVLALKTASTIFNANEKSSLNIQMQLGSFGLISPSIRYKKMFGSKIQMQLNAWYLSAKNNYPFVSYEDNQVQEKRINSAIKANRFEYDFVYKQNDSNYVEFKTFYYASSRGLPGAIILFNQTSNQFLDDKNIFSQIKWSKKYNTKSETLFGIKVSSNNNLYIDSAYPNNAGRLENDFRQKEIYFTAGYKYHIVKNLSVAFSSDFFINKLTRKDSFFLTFPQPIRNTYLNNIAIAYKIKAINIQGNLLQTTISDKVENGPIPKRLHKLTPSIAASVKLFKDKEIYARAFYKNIFRAPTFNDLYYTNIGNTSLRPEFVKQFNAGLTFQLLQKLWVDKILITADAYHNLITDKILAVPRQNLFQWSMQNIGKVKIKGVDVTVQANKKIKSNIEITSSFAYTFQQASDVSDINASEYKTQLPYTPQHTFNAQLNFNYHSFFIGYNFFGTSARYRQGEQINENLLSAFGLHDFNIGYSHKENLSIILSANNVFNTAYEIVKYYPMPQNNFNLTLHFKIKNK
jgi:vitamin B12 transporter